mmetsp:Transcript_1003/g.2995  ORF Transcript_1003/g.2995 Transcript_1003/m.2995 type:complete len:216 (-) Transcript_1003:154-801(-)
MLPIHRPGSVPSPRQRPVGRGRERRVKRLPWEAVAPAPSVATDRCRAVAVVRKVFQNAKYSRREGVRLSQHPLSLPLLRQAQVLAHHAPQRLEAPRNAEVHSQPGVRPAAPLAQKALRLRLKLLQRPREALRGQVVPDQEGQLRTRHRRGARRWITRRSHHEHAASSKRETERPRVKTSSCLPLFPSTPRPRPPPRPQCSPLPPSPSLAPPWREF